LEQAFNRTHASGLPSGLMPSEPLAVGERAPQFTLPSSTGQPVALADHLARGPVVLAWYLFDFGRV
jgi:peroxiredoxin